MRQGEGGVHRSAIPAREDGSTFPTEVRTKREVSYSRKIWTMLMDNYLGRRRRATTALSDHGVALAQRSMFACALQFYATTYIFCAELIAYHRHPTLCALCSLPCPVQVCPSRVVVSEMGVPLNVPGKAVPPSGDSTTRTATMALY